MKDTPASDPMIDDIAALIDEALADPSRATFVKAQVRRRLAARSPEHPPPLADDAFDGDDEDLWENIPL